MAHSHTVVTTVRSAAKGQKILDAHPDVSKDQLSYVIVEDVAEEGAFDKVVKADPPFDAVIHTASPFTFKFDKPIELLDPAIKGTTGILKAIKAHAPSVKRVVITSSFAAITSPERHPSVYDENMWNPVTYEEGLSDRAKTYRASKTLAEKAAWSFVENEKPNFSLATICPPLVLGPVLPYLSSLDSINTSNAQLLSLTQGGWKEKLPPTGTWLWVDVRDAALAHVRAMEVPEAGGKRFFVTAGHYDMAEVAAIAKKYWAVQLPGKLESDKPNPVYGYDNGRSKDILGLSYLPLEKCVVDAIASLKVLGADLETVCRCVQ